MGPVKRQLSRNPQLLKAAKGQPCQWCGKEDGTTVAAHSNLLRHGKGMGIKADDKYVAFLCHSCHHAIDQGRWLTKEQRSLLWGKAHERTKALLRRNGYDVWGKEPCAGEAEAGGTKQDGV